MFALEVVRTQAVWEVREHEEEDLGFSASSQEFCVTMSCKGNRSSTWIPGIRAKLM